MRKRSCGAVRGFSKRLKTAPLGEDKAPCNSPLFETPDFVQFPSQTQIQLETLGSQAPALQGLPKLLFVHQLFKPNQDNNAILKEIAELEKTKVVKSFSLGTKLTKALVFTEELTNYLLRTYKPNPRIEHFIKEILPDFRQMHVYKSELELHKSIVINELIQFGLLVRRSPESYTFAIPGINKFISSFEQARKQILTTIKRSKQKKIARDKLAAIWKQKANGITFDYILADIMGANLVSYNERDQTLRFEGTS